MIAYRDFHLRSLRPGFFGIGKDDTSVTFDGAVEAANDWVSSDGVRVINVETVRPPEVNPIWLRVWYEAADAGRNKVADPEI